MGAIPNSNGIYMFKETIAIVSIFNFEQVNAGWEPISYSVHNYTVTSLSEIYTSYFMIGNIELKWSK